MKLINDIIGELVDYEKPLANALLKTKVLAMQINNSNLINWVNGELIGFSESEPLPGYRKTTGEIKGTFLNGNWQYTNQSISIAHLNEERYNSIKAIHMLDSVAALEELFRNNSSINKISISAETKSYIEESIRRMGNPYFQILSIHREVSPTFISNIMISIRSKLLEFLLNIQREFGAEVNIESLKESNQAITNIMNTTINNNGDGNLINTGENNNIKSKIEIKKGDKQNLIKILKENHVDEEDINDLINVVDQEFPIDKNHFGNLVTTWIHKMIGKAIDGSWQVGIGAAGTILADALQTHYGLK